MAREFPGNTLQPTALVHEAYLRLAANGDSRWNNRKHFFKAAAEAMRRILIEHARRKHALKRGGESERVPLEEIDVAAKADAESLLVVEEAIRQLQQRDPLKAEIVKLLFFVGLSHAEAADVLDLSEPTVKRHWRYGRTWLLHEVERLRLSR
jgi:RNA polymerase sigma factor (TIGR02999 family)